MSEEQKRELEKNHHREMDFRRLLSDVNLQAKYDERLNHASNLVKAIKYSVFEADKRLSVGERDRQGSKIIFEAVEMLNKLKEIVGDDKKEKLEREAYVRGKFRIDANIPFTSENF